MENEDEAEGNEEIMVDEDTNLKDMGIFIRRPKRDRPEGISNINKILLPSFVTMIIGKPGSGKSHLLHEMITNKTLYYKRFNKVLFVTPTKLRGLEDSMDDSNWVNWLNIPWLEKRFEEIREGFKEEMLEEDRVIGEKKVRNNAERERRRIEREEEMELAALKKVNKKRVKKGEEELDLESFRREQRGDNFESGDKPEPEEMVEDEKDEIDIELEKERRFNDSMLGKKRHRNVLIVFDDLTSAIKECSNDKTFLNLFFNRRNLIPNCTVSMFVVSQKYMMIPTVVRSASNGVIFFRQNMNDMKKIMEECGADVTPVQRNYIFSLLKSSPHSFVFLRTDTGELFVNFKKLF